MDLKITKIGVPIAAGQMEITRSGMRDLMVDGAIDVSNYDASWGGGPTEWRRVAQMAMSFGVEMGHHEEAQVSSHQLASIPHGTYVECFHPSRDPIFGDCRQIFQSSKTGILSFPQDPALAGTSTRLSSQSSEPTRDDPAVVGSTRDECSIVKSEERM